MSLRHWTLLILCLWGTCLVPVLTFAQEPNHPSPAGPRIESVVMLPKQPHEADPNVIWYDDFDGPAKAYTESTGGLDANCGFAGRGGSMPCLYEKGALGKGNRKVFFGDSPTGKVVRKGQVFEEVYWRVYVRHQPGWKGGSPAKLSRATSIVSPNWAQAMIAHVWGGAGDVLTLDPARGVRGDKVVTTRYNDFDNLHWLGNKPVAEFPISSTAESGWWVCVECRAKLNTPGRKDGLNQLWIDGRLEAERKDLDWRGSYKGHGINAVFLEAYWNGGSPVTQLRWYDNFVISAGPIGPVACPPNPTLIRTPYAGPGKAGEWEAEAAADADGRNVVWRSKPQRGANRVTVDGKAGQFVGSQAGKARLSPGPTYYGRLRQRLPSGAWGEWSPWHQGFAVGE